MKDWKLTGARGTLPYLNLCCLSVGSSHMVMPLYLDVLQVKLKTQAVVVLLSWSLFPICIMELFIYRCSPSQTELERIII